MSTHDLIAIQQFCKYYDVPISFIDALHEYDLIELVSYKETTKTPCTLCAYIFYI